MSHPKFYHKKCRELGVLTEFNSYVNTLPKIGKEYLIIGGKYAGEKAVMQGNRGLGISRLSLVSSNLLVNIYNRMLVEVNDETTKQ